MVSKHPARPLPHAFDVQVYSSARVQVAGVALADTWVTIGMMYGFPCNASHKQARYQTDAMLADLVDRVGCQAAGPRAIGGDFNFGPDELGQLHRLHTLGFTEVQDLRAWRTGHSVEATGRGSKRIDQLWISPELQRALTGVKVEFDHWADHAAVMATFEHAGLVATVASWPTPLQFPWPKEWTCQVDTASDGDLSVGYAKFWNQVETQAKCWVRHQGVPVVKGQFGRASVLEPKMVKEHLAPVKKGHLGDVQPSYMGVSLQHARFFKQLRRLQSLSRILAKGVATWSGRINRDETLEGNPYGSWFPRRVWGVVDFTGMGTQAEWTVAPSLPCVGLCPGPLCWISTVCPAV